MSDTTLTPERLVNMKFAYMSAKAKGSARMEVSREDFGDLIDVAEENATLRAERDELEAAHKCALDAWEQDIASRDAALAEVTREQWRPIETAPKDGSRLVITNGSGFPAIARWSRSYEDWMVGDNQYFDPTHWRPLPISPADEAKLRREVARLTDCNPGIAPVS